MLRLRRDYLYLLIEDFREEGKRFVYGIVFINALSIWNFSASS
jgi:hypothetical protein